MHKRLDDALIKHPVEFDIKLSKASFHQYEVSVLAATAEINGFQMKLELSERYSSYALHFMKFTIQITTAISNFSDE